MNGLAAGQPVELCVRPEAITLRPPSGKGGIAGQIEQAAFLGTTIQYLVRTAGGEPLTVLAPKAGGRLPVGADVALSWSPDEARVLGGDASGSQEEAPG
jgi:spermidine/putrescine transport system ATP-binding protein